MFAHTTPSLRYMLAALLVAALPLAGCPDENNQTTTPADMGDTTPDQGDTTPDQGDTTPDMGDTTPDQGDTTPDQGEPDMSVMPDQGDDTDQGMLCMDGSMTCFLNEDCPATQRCESEGGSGSGVSTSGCCRDGARGSATFGQECTGSDDCESGLCIGGDDGKSYCSKMCESSDDCADSPLAKCQSLYFVCIPES